MKPASLRWTFKVGCFEPRPRITVWADDRETAALKARAKLDRRAERAGDEPPVAWDLELIAVVSKGEILGDERSWSDGNAIICEPGPRHH